MKVIILSAGQGSRLGSLTRKKPKCLVELNGKTILDYQLELYKKKNIDEVFVISGYKEKKIISDRISKIYNPNYKTTNMVASLFCAEEYFDDDLIISYSDIIYNKEVLKQLIRNKHDIVVTVDKDWFELWKIRMDDPLIDAETMKLDSDKNIIELGKRANNYNEINGQYIGLIKLSNSILLSRIKFISCI